MNKRKGIIVAILAGGCVVLIAFLALRWREIATEYHILRLHTTPDYIDQIVASPEGSPACNAVIKYVQTAQGQKVLQDALFTNILRSPFEIGGGPWPDSTTAIVFSERRFRIEGPFETSPVRSAQLRNLQLSIDSDDGPNRPRFRPFLPWVPLLKHVQPEKLKFPDIPEFVFDIDFDEKKRT